MANRIVRDIVGRIKSSGSYFSIVVDDTTDVSTTEQVVFVLRWVDDDLEPYEEFLGINQTASIDANTLVALVKDILIMFNIDMKSCRGQCYDGAANMAAVCAGVAKQILAVEPRPLYTHCYGHSLNLACQHTIREIKVLRNAIDMTLELPRLLKYSSKGNATYKKLKEELSPGEPGFRTLCPTRWTMRADFLARVEANYCVLQNSLDEFFRIARKDLETSVKVHGVATEMTKFDFLFGVMLGSRVLRLVDNLSRKLQKTEQSAAEGQISADATIKEISALRTDKKFSEFWRNVEKNLNL